MIVLYKIWKNKIKEIKWDINVVYYNQVMENTRESTI